MRILTINCGSATLKFDVLDASMHKPGNVSRVASGIVDGIGSNSVTSLSVAGNAREVRTSAGDHHEAYALAAGMLQESAMFIDDFLAFADLAPRRW